jgi:site-specific recombinase XerD
MNPRPKTTRFGVPFSISFYFDNRNRIDSHPECGSILLNVYDRVNQKRAYIGLKIYSTADVFEALTGKFTKVKAEDHKGKTRVKPLTQQAITQIKQKNIVLEAKLSGLMDKAQEVNNFDMCKTLSEFKLQINQSLSYSFNDIAQTRIEQLEKNKQWGTKAVAESALEAVARFHFNDSLIKHDHLVNGTFKVKSIKTAKREWDKAKHLTFYDINSDFLNGFEAYLKNDGSTPNTISIYIREIRTIYNIAIDSGLVKRANYPFGNTNNPIVKKYKIQSEEVAKPVLNKEDWQTLIKYKTPFVARQKALDMFLLSYALQGANTNDMCKLLKTDVSEDSIKFFRKKSEKTSNVLVKRLVTRTPFIDHMFLKYAAPINSPYVLDLLDRKFKVGDENTHKRCKGINRNFNRSLETICATINIPRISMMWARHQRSTNFRENGGTIEELNLILGHKKMTTTKIYDHSLPSKSIKDNSANLDNELMNNEN